MWSWDFQFAIIIEHIQGFTLEHDCIHGSDWVDKKLDHIQEAVSSQGVFIDVREDNFIVTEDGRLVVIDFDDTFGFGLDEDQIRKYNCSDIEELKKRLRGKDVKNE